MAEFPRGSEWRRWELHIHTPETLKNDRFIGTTNEQKWAQYYSDIKAYINANVPERNITAMGVTDYLSIDNYLKIKKDKQLPDSITLIIPNVELRITPVTGGATPINIHCLFSPDIDSQLESRFFGKLKFAFGTSTYSASKSELIRLGRDYSNDQEMDEVSARKIGAEQYVISFDILSEIFTQDSPLRKKTLIIVSNSSNDGASGLNKHSDYFVGFQSQLDATRRSIYQIADAVFSANESDILYFCGKGVDCVDEVNRKCGGLMPCFHGCDAHENAKIFKPDQERNCWIKADPTFEGLKQVLNEPNDRVYIGKIPEVINRVYENKTKYITELFVDAFQEKEDTSNIWFKSIHIPLNNELVTIIGNKGSGKSAIADIIGICTDAEHSKDFLFLNDKKFKKKGCADRFFANLLFASGIKTEDRALSYDIKSTDLPKVQYLPQQYFETICNEVGKIESFQKEIEKVVFQYIPEEKKLKKNSFSELIDFKKDSIDKEIIALRNQLDEINKTIITLEDQKNPNFIKRIQSEKKVKEDELKTHIDQKPPSKENPREQEETVETKTQRENLRRWESKQKKYSSLITQLGAKNNSCAFEVEELKQFKRDIENKAKEIRQFLEQKHSFIEKYSFDISQIFNIECDLRLIDSAINQRETLNAHRKLRLGTSELPEKPEFNKLRLKAKLIFCNEEIESIHSTLSQADQEYQKYFSDLEKWENKRKEIEGSKEKAGTLEYIQDRIHYIENDLEKDLTKARENRLLISKSIYGKKIEIKSFYDEIKTEIATVLADNQDQNLTIDSSFTMVYDFCETFMSFINKNRVGSFRGQEDGKKILQDKILSSLEINDGGSIIEFLKRIIEYLECDKREEHDQIPTFIDEQVSKRVEFYQYLFSLGYIESHYELRQNGKSLDKLSPGEKGALLLVFYLVLDKNEIPLVIDQPEDNLDNHSVAKVLVPFIKKAKKHRQIIMVTHNPNLAIVADAEQVIHVNIDKENGNKFSFTSGSIENSTINQETVDVLEGTMPAFTMRKNKYQ